MTEYSLVALVVLVFCWLLNERFNPYFKKKTLVLGSLFVVLVAQLLADNWATARGFWVFNDAVTLGLRVPFIPVENLFFGMALFLVTVFWWEFFSKKEK